MEMSRGVFDAFKASHRPILDALAEHATREVPSTHSVTAVVHETGSQCAAQHKQRLLNW
jgi:hypothetical protein